MTRRREATPNSSRRASREFAFRVLFESAQGQSTTQDTLQRAEGAMRGGDDAYASLSPEALDFARSLVNGYNDHRDEVDGLLRRTIQGWSFNQMAQTDLNVLRLATSELLYGNQSAPPVIESAVRIARKFGGDESGRFVNGVLASLVRALPAQDSRPSPGDERPTDEETAE
ncbi:transcription antitermination factor NusB [Deinococcus peraridilitoris]|uniref:Transcription antitermination protein NusB n=1 Tax=Deinococcus peraridilitoris (strain DSM 19664 / LMG 22246 / CIP 109416 / KR-200) TaxID=937777 RepID=L0A7G2_DEIPD|nr:transcription antitermination factor NusB [Deinococcus peraridilitoris]AFZ69097.1 transcription antitermination factor NusB [Deinococcus peraridilitoris DSM 19664]